jgi:hypothetical protein
MDQFRRRGLYPFGIAGAPAIRDRDVVTVGPAQPLEWIEERRDTRLSFSIGRRVVGHQHANPPGLLRACRNRQRDSSCAKHAYELPPSDADCHSTRP